MVSITGQKIDYNGVGALKGQGHIPGNINPSTSSHTPRLGLFFVVVLLAFGGMGMT